MRKFLLALLLLTGGGLLSYQPAVAQCLEGQIDVNSAPEEALEEITQIGPVLAGRIVEERNKAPFISLDDLVRVKGIGEKTLEKIKSEGLACVETAFSEDQDRGQQQEEDQQEKAQGGQEEEQETQPESGSLNLAPVAEAGEDILTTAGRRISFDASASYDPEGKSLEFFWNLGDGNTRQEQSFDYAYSYPGKYLVVLEVFDGKWKAQDTLEVIVYPSGVHISEFLPNPEGEDTQGEWIELYNSNPEAVDISSWQLDDEEGGSSPFVFPQHTLIVPYGFLVLERSLTKLALNNNSDTVRLLYPTGEVADQVSYEKGGKEGQSAARKGDDFFWTSLPTPGLQNLIFLSAKELSFLDKKENEVGQILEESRKQIRAGLSSSQVATPSPAQKRLTQPSGLKVAFPTLADLDNILDVREAQAAKNSWSFKEDAKKEGVRFSAALEQLLDENLGKIKFGGPEILLLFTTTISSTLLGIWIYLLKHH